MYSSSRVHEKNLQKMLQYIDFLLNNNQACITIDLKNWKHVNYIIIFFSICYLSNPVEEINYKHVATYVQII